MENINKFCKCGVRLSLNIYEVCVVPRYFPIAEVVLFLSANEGSEWDENLYEFTLADASRDQIIYNAYAIQIEGESMRERKSRLDV